MWLVFSHFFYWPFEFRLRFLEWVHFSPIFSLSGFYPFPFPFLFSSRTISKIISSQIFCFFIYFLFFLKNGVKQKEFCFSGTITRKHFFLYLFLFQRKRKRSFSFEIEKKKKTKARKQPNRALIPMMNNKASRLPSKMLQDPDWLFH